MTSYDTNTSGTSPVLTVASLQRLKMEAHIPASADCDVQSVIKSLNAQSIALIKIRQLCQVYGHTWLDGQHISCRSSAGRCLIIIHPIVRTSHLVISIFSYTSRNSCPVSVSFIRMTEAEMNATVVPISGDRLLRHRIQKLSHGMTNFSISEVNMLKNSSTFAVSVPMNLSITLGLVSVNSPKDTYFVDMLRTFPETSREKF